MSDSVDKFLDPVFTLTELNKVWKEYGITIQTNRRKKSSHKFSLIHADLGKHNFQTLEEVQKWLIVHEKELALKCQLEPKNLLIRYHEKYPDSNISDQTDEALASLDPEVSQNQQKIETKLISEEINITNESEPLDVVAEESPVEPDESEVKTPYLDDSDQDSSVFAGSYTESRLFDDEEMLSVPLALRDVLKKPNESFYASVVTPTDYEIEQLECLKKSKAKKLDKVAEILRSMDKFISDNPSRTELSSVLSEMGFSVRFFGNARLQNQPPVSCCIAASRKYSS